MIILRQKEYGLKRNLSAIIGRGRRRLAEKLDRIIVGKSAESANQAFLHSGAPKPKISEGVSKKILEDLENNKDILVSRDGTLSAGGAAMGLIDEQITSRLGKDAVKGKKFLLVAPETASPAEIAHELGHIDNYDQAIYNIIAKSNRDITSSTFAQFSPGERIIQSQWQPMPLGTEESLRETGIRNYFRRKRAIKLKMKDELAANRRAIERLRKAGASEQEIKEAEEFLANSTKTYLPGSVASVLIPIRNRIQIPSRRGDFAYGIVRERVKNEPWISGRVKNIRTASKNLKPKEK